MAAYTRTPRESWNRVTIVESANSAIETDMKWAVQCDAHLAWYGMTTKAKALRLKSQNFCTFCHAELADVDDTEDVVNELPTHATPVAPMFEPRSARDRIYI